VDISIITISILSCINAVQQNGNIILEENKLRELEKKLKEVYNDLLKCTSPEHQMICPAKKI